MPTNVSFFDFCHLTHLPVMFRSWTRTWKTQPLLRPAFSSHSPLSRRAMSQSTVEFVSSYLFGEPVPCCPSLAFSETRTPTHHSLVETHSDKRMPEYRIKSSMPHSPRWTPKFKISSTR